MESIETVLQRVFSKGKFAQRTQLAELACHWSEIVGKDIAIHCEPEKISNGKLYVKIDSPLWHQQVDLLKEELLDKVGCHLQHLGISKIVCKSK
jgi:predicted nucleic acid-binding Zn ribbon protein